MMPNSHRVLLVEDNLHDADMMRRMIAESAYASFALEHVARLEEGLRRLEVQPFALVLLDLSLPDSQGLDTFARVHTQSPNVPIVVLTGSDDEALAIESVRAGAQDYLVKHNVVGPLLVRACRHAIERHRLIEQLEEVRRSEEEQRDEAERLRGYQHYLVLGREGDTACTSRRATIDAQSLDELADDYYGIVIRYVRALRFGEERPSTDVGTFARRLAGLRAHARDVVQVHLRILDRISHSASPSEERAIARDARLVLIDLFGNLLDIYLNVCESTAGEGMSQR